MCTRPQKCYINPDGGRDIFSVSRGIKEGLQEKENPCGTCPECCKNYYTSWAIRGDRELSQWDSSVFITLTYNEEHLPANFSLDKREIQNFLKRVKKHFNSTRSNPVRQIYAGEYGSQTLRPHYHAVLFNVDFVDKIYHRTTERGDKVYTSPTLNRLWSKNGKQIGFAEFGYAQPGAIGYIFKYILKKKSRKEKRVPLIHEVNGITYEVSHEFIESSRNPGIGAVMRQSDSILKGYLSVDGVRKKLPKYLSEHLRKTNPRVYEEIQDKKFDYMSKLPKENALRLSQKEKAQKALTDTKKKL